MFENLLILFGLLPFLIVFLGGIFTLAQVKEERQFGFILIFIGAALIMNTILLFVPDLSIEHSSISINQGQLLLSELILFFGLILGYASRTNLSRVYHKDYVGVVYLVFLSCLIGLTLTRNLLLLVMFFLLAVVFLIQLFFFGEYEKEVFQLKRFLTIAAMSFGFLSLGVLTTYLGHGTFDLPMIKTNIGQNATLLDTFSMLLFLGGFGGILGMIPFGMEHLREFFEESNPLSFKAFSILFTPVTLILLFNVLTSFTLPTVANGTLFFLIGAPGLTVTLLFIILELFGKFRAQSVSLKKVYGFSTAADVNILLLIMSTLYLNEFQTTTPLAFFYLVLTIMVSKGLMYEALNPIFEDKENDVLDLKVLGGYYQMYPRLVYYLLGSVVVFCVPFFTGSGFLELTLSIVFEMETIAPVNRALLTLVFILLLAWMLVFLLQLAVIIAECFFGKPKYRKITSYEKLEKIYHVTPITLIIFFVALGIGQLISVSFLSGMNSIIGMLFV